MDRDDQKMVNFYHRIAKACAENKISIMFHGAFPPKGLIVHGLMLSHRRCTGAEWNIWSELATPDHNVANCVYKNVSWPVGL
jgi:alpha-glucosidase